MFFETKKTSGPVQGLLAVKVARAKQRIAAVPKKPLLKRKPKRD